MTCSVLILLISLPIWTHLFVNAYKCIFCAELCALSAHCNVSAHTSRAFSPYFEFFIAWTSYAYSLSHIDLNVRDSKKQLK